MSVALGATWNPRGELPRLQRILPQLREAYLYLALCLPPHVEEGFVAEVGRLPGLAVERSPQWSWGRHLAVAAALQSTATHIQYADLDRLLRWVETKPDEWRQALEATLTADCLIVGRTAQAYATHPEALRQTERLSNRVFSALLGQEMDLSAGVKGFSRRAAEFLMAHSQPGRALGVDAEWPVLLHRGGFQIEMLWVEGLDWESADRYLDQAADPAAQRQAAAAYDRDPANWARRVAIACEIVEAGLQAFHQSL